VADARDSIEIRPLSFPDDVLPFVRSWWRIYRDDPHWVPPLLFERKRFFDPAVNPYFEVADVQCFLAIRAGEALGTIGAAVDHNYQREDSGAGFFGLLGFRWPGRIAAGASDAVVQSVDVLPTVLALAGLPVPPDVDGRDLSPLLLADTVELEGRPAFAEMKARATPGPAPPGSPPCMGGAQAVFS
jgi:hypothetical protein